VTEGGATGPRRAGQGRAGLLHDGMHAVASALGSMTVLDEHGAAVPLGPLWRDRPVVLLFVRHFG
jgi:hypothetical protein